MDKQKATIIHELKKVKARIGYVALGEIENDTQDEEFMEALNFSMQRIDEAIRKIRDSK